MSLNVYIIVKLRECSGKGILCQTGKASELHTRVEAKLLYLYHIQWRQMYVEKERRRRRPAANVCR